MYLKNIVKKIPGDLPPLSKDENQGYIGDLESKRKFELQELLERQNKLLANKSFILKLPDKGEKIKVFRDRIIKQLEHRNEVEKAAVLLSRLNIASEGKSAMNELEWTGKYTEKSGEDTVKIVELDSDDEENPLKILAQPTGTGVHKKKVIHLAPEESLIKPEDIAEIESFGIDNPEVEHVKYIVDKVAKAEENKQQKRESFKPYKTTKSNVHAPEKEKGRKLNKNWEVTAATPPLIVHGAAKVLSLNDSLVLQKKQADELQVIQAKHAAERLAEQFGFHTIGDGLPEKVGDYRTQDDQSSSCNSDYEEHEVHDEEDNDRGGTVVYTVENVEH